MLSSCDLQRNFDICINYTSVFKFVISYWSVLVMLLLKRLDCCNIIDVVQAVQCTKCRFCCSSRHSKVTSTHSAFMFTFWFFIGWLGALMGWKTSELEMHMGLVYPPFWYKQCSKLNEKCHPHRRMGQFCLGGAEPSLPVNFFNSARKKLLC